MRIMTIALALAGVVAAAAPAYAGAHSPFTPPPATGVETPLIEEYAASVATTTEMPHCGTGEPTAVWVNGSLVKPWETTATASTATAISATASPSFVNGAGWPATTPGEALADGSWCGGGYRPDAGTNFGG
jgi:hypothetical protein